MPEASQLISEFKGDNLSVKMFGAKGDGVQITDAAMTNGSNVLHSPSGPFTGQDIPGMIVAVAGAGAAGATLFTSVVSVTDPSNVVLAANASATVSAAQAIYGTDDAAAFQAAWSGTITSTGVTPGVDLPNGIFCVSAGFTIPSGCSLRGRGRGVSAVAFLASTGNCIFVNLAQNVTVEKLAVICIDGPTTAVGIKAYGVQSLHVDCRVSGFDVSYYITGNDTTQFSNDVWLHEPDLRLFRTAGLKCDHTTGLHLKHGILRTADNNPLTAMGFIFDTGTSGIYIEQCDLEFCAVLIQNTMPTVNAVGYPPQFYFWDSVIADTCPNHGIHLDASLGVPDGLSRVAKSLYFTKCWGAGTTVNGTDGMLIEGGQDIVVTNPRMRVNKRHGLHVTGGQHIRIVNPSCLGNNFQNTANGAGIYIEGATTGRVSVLGGLCGDNVAGEGSGFQYWGIYVASTFVSPHIIQGVQYDGNQTGGLSDNSAASYQQHFGFMDLTGGDQIHRLFMPKGRLEIGDGGFYLDFMHDLANAVALVLDANMFIRTVRGSNLLQIVTAGGGIAEIFAILRLTTTSASNPLRTDASNNVISGQIDLGNATDIKATGVTNGHLLEWNGSVVVDGGAPISLPVSDSTSIVEDDGDATKQMRFEVGGLTTGTTRVLTVPDRDQTLGKTSYLTAVPTGLPQSIPGPLAAIADVAGASVTLNLDGDWEIDACIDMNGDNNTGQVVVRLNYNGTDETDTQIEANVSASGGDSFAGTYSAHWIIVGNTGSKVAKLRAYKAANASTAQIVGGRITAKFLG